MDSTMLAERAAAYLKKLCLEIPTRRVGTPGNREAVDFFEQVITSFGFEVESQPFDCLDWAEDGASLSAGGHFFQVLPSPYTNGIRAEAGLVAVSTLAELESAPAEGKILLLRGQLTREQLMPKNFPFYNPEEHQHLIALLESKKPLALLAATTRDPEMAGAVYPFPLIEDGDFDIPTAYMTGEEGDRLAAAAGSRVSLEIRARRWPSSGRNLVARKGAFQRRVVIFGHIDAKTGTPGAVDNAAGAATLLLLAELLRDYSGRLGIEIVPLNGEDDYSAAGEKAYLHANQGRFEDILLGINLDAVGFHQGRTAYSLYDCPDSTASQVKDVFDAEPGMTEGEQWYQSDHGLFIQNGVPALALTSDCFVTLLAEIAHTVKDVPSIVDPSKLVETALALHRLLLRLERSFA